MTQSSKCTSHIKQLDFCSACNWILRGGEPDSVNANLELRCQMNFAQKEEEYRIHIF